MAVIRPGPRIERLLELLGQAWVVADIGTDHGLLPVAAVLRGQAQRAIGTDLRPGPLEAASRLVARTGTQDRVELRQGPGLTPLAPGEADAVVIAGLHGETIASILREGAARLTPRTRLLLQPTRGVAALRLPAWDREGGRWWPAAASGTARKAASASGLDYATAYRPQHEAEYSSATYRTEPRTEPRTAHTAATSRTAPASMTPQSMTPHGTVYGTEHRAVGGTERGTVSGAGTVRHVRHGHPPAAAGSQSCLGLALEGESLVASGRHTYVLITGRVVEHTFDARWFSMVDEPAFIWLWDPPVAEAAQRLARLARECGIDPLEAMARVGPALLAPGHADGATGPLLRRWLDELARPWRKAMRANAGSTARAAGGRRLAAAWLLFLGKVADQAEGNIGPGEGTGTPPGG